MWLTGVVSRRQTLNTISNVTSFSSIESDSAKQKKKKAAIQDQDEIDRFVISQAADDSAWEAPMHVKRSRPASLSIPGELAARASFLARLHREAGIDKWVERVIRERVELEELAFTEAKKKLAS